MVQATMANKKEYKVVLFKGEARYIFKASTNKKGIAFSSKPELMNFAIEFASACPNALVDSLMRVDIFQTTTGKLVVNELESLSLEADHLCNNGLDRIAVDNEVRLYYEMVLRSIIDELHLR